MKIGIFLGFYTLESGGGMTFETEIVRSLIDYGADSQHTFVVYSWNKDVPREMQSDRHLQFVSLFSLKHSPLSIHNSFHQWLSPLKIGRVIHFFKKNDKRRVLNTSFGIKDVDLMWHLTPFRCLTMEIPYITTVWDIQHRLQPYFPEVSAEGRWNNRERFYDTMLRRATFVVTGTEVAKHEIRQFYQVSADRIKVLPLPTPHFVFTPSSTSQKAIIDKYHLPPNYLFYPAQFWSHKNHISLLLAVKWLRDTYNLVFPVVFVGSDQGNLSYIQQVVSQLELSSQIYFLGFIPQQDLMALYRYAFALTFVSLFGPDNLPPLEAFALGCPVIASDVPGAQEQLGDAAFLVEPCSEQSIGLAIKHLYDTPSFRQTLVERGLRRASAWTGEHYMQRMFSLFDEFAAIRRCWSPDTSVNVSFQQEWLDRFPKL